MGERASESARRSPNYKMSLCDGIINAVRFDRETSGFAVRLLLFVREIAIYRASPVVLDDFPAVARITSPFPK